MSNLRQKSTERNDLTLTQIDEVLASPLTTDWEKQFCLSLAEWHSERPLTTRQGSVLDRIWRQRCCARRGRATDPALFIKDMFGGRYRAPRRATLSRGGGHDSSIRL